MFVQSVIKSEKGVTAVKIKKENGCEEEQTVCEKTAVVESKDSEIKVENDHSKSGPKQDKDLNLVFESNDNDNEGIVYHF